MWLQRLRNRWTCRPARPLPEPTWPLRSPWPLNTQHICSNPWATAHNVKTFRTHFHSLAQVKPGHRKKSTVHAGKKNRLATDHVSDNHKVLRLFLTWKMQHRICLVKIQIKSFQDEHCYDYLFNVLALQRLSYSYIHINSRLSALEVLKGHVTKHRPISRFRWNLQAFFISDATINLMIDFSHS